MKKINKYDLDFEQTIPYFIDHIECGLALSEKVIKKIDFRTGSFFTLLLDSAALERLYDFKGSILPLKGKAKNIPFKNAWVITTTKEELSEFIFSFLEKNTDGRVILEHVIAYPTDPHLVIPGVKLAFYRKEIYYEVESGTATDVILHAIRVISEVWHFLVILTKGLGSIKAQLKEDDFDAVCDHARYVIAGAYDGEGYIFWEKDHGR